MIIRGNSVGFPLSDPRKGLNMQGDINMNGRKITGLSTPTADDEAVPFGYTKEKLQAKHESVSVVLPADGWAELTQTVAVAGVTTDNDIIVTYSAESRTALNEAGVYASGQGNGTLAFSCEEIPAADLTVNVLILD